MFRGSLFTLYVHSVRAFGCKILHDLKFVQVGTCVHTYECMCAEKSLKTSGNASEKGNWGAVGWGKE